MSNASESLFEKVMPYDSVSVIGMAKNAGKTTVLNSLIRECRRSGIIPGLSSAGRDGEDTDIVTLTQKPEIYVYKGFIFATAKQLLGLCDVTKELLYSTGYNTPLGEVYIVRAMSDGYIQLGGPSQNTQTEALKHRLFGFGARKVFIDGALGRKSFSSPEICEACVLCTGASFSGSMAKTVEETAFVAELFSLAAFSDENAAKILRQKKKNANLVFINRDYSYELFSLRTNLDLDDIPVERITDYTRFVYAAGAVTDSLLERLPAAGCKSVTLVADNASKFFLSKKVYKKFVSAGNSVNLLKKTELCAICVNPVSPDGFDYDAKEFESEMSKETGIPVFNIAEE